MNWDSIKSILKLSITLICGCSKGLYTSTKGCIDPFSYYMMSSGRSILASSLLYSIMLCFIIIFVNDRCPRLGASALYLCFTLRPAIFNSLRPVTIGSGRTASRSKLNSYVRTLSESKSNIFLCNLQTFRNFFTRKNNSVR